MGLVTGSISGPLGGSLRGGIAAGGRWHGNLARNALDGGPDGNDESAVNLRGQLLWSPSGRLDLRLIAGYLGRDDKEGESDVVFVPGSPSADLVAALQQQGLTGTCPDNRPHNRVSCSVATNHLDLDASDATLIADYRFENGWTLHSITGYEHYRDRRDEDDAAQFLAPILFFHDSEEATALQEELRLASADDAQLPWLVGVFRYTYDYERGSRGRRPMFGPNGALAFEPFWLTTIGLPFATPGQEGLHDSRLQTDHFAGFGQVTLPLANRFDLTAAARWAREEKHASIDNSVTVPGISVISRVLTPDMTATGEPVNGSLQRASDDFTWSLTPRYETGAGGMLYATWTRGGKFGGFNTGFGNAPLSQREFGDETINHFEIGGRFRFDGNRGRLGIAAYRSRYHDYQDSAFIGAQFTVGNAERVDLKGAELEMEYQFPSGTRANLALSVADLTYGRNTTGMCYPGRVPDGSLPGSCDLSGEHPVDAPLGSAQLGVEQPFALGSMPARLRLDWSWTDRYQTSFSGDPRLVQGAYHDVALRFGLALSPSVDLELAGENLLDETVVYFDSVLNFFNDASYQSFVALPRRISVTLKARM
jgi:iron complex outermembrane receptor protein